MGKGIDGFGGADIVNDDFNVESSILDYSDKVPEKEINKLEEEKQIDFSDSKIDTNSDLALLSSDIDGNNDIFRQKTIQDNINLKSQLNGKIVSVPKKIYNEYNRSTEKIRSEQEQNILIIQNDLLENVKEIPQNNENEQIKTHLKVTGSYQKSHIKNDNIQYNTNTTRIFSENGKYYISKSDSIYGLNFEDLSTTEFQGTYMKEIEDLIKNSDGTMQSFINGLNKKGYTEADLLKTMAALSAEAFIRTYDNKLMEAGNNGIGDTYSYAKNVLNRDVDGDTLIQNLQQSINTGQHIDTLTCNNYATIIAQVLKTQGYDIVETGTIDVGVQHRFTALKGKDGMTHIISDGQIFSGKNYAQAYTNYQAKQASITFQSDIFDSNNKYLGSYQTETMKHLGNIVSANGSLNTQNLAKNISKNGIDTKSSLELEIGNFNNKISYQKINKNGNGYYASIEQKNIANEGTNIISGKTGLIQTLEGENSNFQIREGVSYSQIEFNNGNKISHGGLSIEATGYKGFNKDKNGNVIKDGVYGSISGDITANVGGIVSDLGERLPISNVNIAGTVGGEIGYNQKDTGKIYVNGSVTGDFLNISNTVDYGNGKLVQAGDSIGVGAEYYLPKDTGTISASLDNDNYKGTNTLTSTIGYENDNLAINLSNTDTSYDYQIVDSENTKSASLSYNLGSGEILGTQLDDMIISTKYKTNKIGGTKNTDAVYLTFGATF